MSKNILLVDDDPGVHLIVAGLLTKAGYTVTIAKTGEEGLHLALNKRPALIILDVIMPGIKGRDLCVKIKAYDVLKNIPVIFLTAKNTPDDIKAEMEAGSLAHLTKPIEPEKFLAVVEQSLSIKS